MLDKILGAINTVFSVIKAILGLFKKPLEKKIESAEQEVRDEMDKFKESGRPKP